MNDQLSDFCNIVCRELVTCVFVVLEICRVDPYWYFLFFVFLFAYSFVEQLFRQALDNIVAISPAQSGSLLVLKALKIIPCKISKPEPKYRIVDTETPGVRTINLGFDGTLEYLKLLQTILQCRKHPTKVILTYCIEIIAGRIKAIHKDIEAKSAPTGGNNNNSNNGNNNGNVLSGYGGYFSPNGSRRNSNRGGDGYGNYGATSGNGGATNHHPHQTTSSYNNGIVTGNNLNGNENGNSGVENDEHLEMDSGEFTISQLIIALITHETYESSEEIYKVLLLCHRCFTASRELLDCIGPDDVGMNDSKKLQEYLNVQRSIQEKCIKLSAMWMREYYNIDFVTQETLMKEYENLAKKIADCSKTYALYLNVRLDCSNYMKTILDTAHLDCADLSPIHAIERNNEILRDDFKYNNSNNNSNSNNGGSVLAIGDLKLDVNGTLPLTKENKKVIEKNRMNYLDLDSDDNSNYNSINDASTIANNHYYDHSLVFMKDKRNGGKEKDKNNKDKDKESNLIYSL